MCTERVINRHWKGKVHGGFGLLALQILACARRCEVQSQVFVRRSEHLSPPLHGLPTSCVCASLCSCDGSWTDANGAWPTARFSKNVLFLALFFISNFSFPEKRRAVQECRACWSLTVVHLYNQSQDLSTAVATVMQ